LGLLRKKLRSYREAKGLSQEEVSFSANIHRTYLSQIELGERNPSFIVLLRICNTLQVVLTAVINEVLAQAADQA
jgi:transcriptional regulator with XRE-family HTH domain